MRGERKEMQNARFEFSGALTEIIRKYDLSYAELFSILADHMKRWADYCIRDEIKEKKYNGELTRERNATACSESKATRRHLKSKI